MYSNCYGTGYGEIEPKQEAALEELGFELPNPEKKRSKTNNRKVVFDSACRTMFLDICKRHGLEIDEEPSYGGRQHLEKQDYIRMKQKEEIAVQQEMLNQQRDKVNANHLELARQSNHVRANEKVIQSQKEKIEQQEKEFKENFISNSDRMLSLGQQRICQRDASTSINNIRQNSMTYNTQYYVVETKAPSGYVLPEEPEKTYFYFSSLDKDKYPVAAPNNSLTGKCLANNYDIVYIGDETIPTTEISVEKNWVDSNNKPINKTDGSIYLQLHRVDSSGNDDKYGDTVEVTTG